MVYDLKKGRALYITYEELKDDYVMYGFPETTVLECQENAANFRSDTFVQGDLVFFVLDLINFLDVFGEKQRLAIYLQKELCVFVAMQDEKDEIKNRFIKTCQFYDDTSSSIEQSVPEAFLYHFLDDLIRQDRKMLENVEFHMSELERRMMEKRLETSFINELLSLKRELICIRNYYEQLVDVGEVLQDNETFLLPDESARLFTIYTQRTRRLSETVSYLKEYTVQLRETHDAMLDYNLNNIMKLFTVITTIFMPLTLIVGWYGMNFDYMPELHWKYGYIGIIMLSFLIVCACFYIFRKYRLL